MDGCTDRHDKINVPPLERGDIITHKGCSTQNESKSYFHDLLNETMFHYLFFLLQIDNQ